VLEALDARAGERADEAVLADFHGCVGQLAEGGLVLAKALVECGLLVEALVVDAVVGANCGHVHLVGPDADDGAILRV